MAIYDPVDDARLEQDQPKKYGKLGYPGRMGQW
jgi:hypothetical protein